MKEVLLYREQNVNGSSTVLTKWMIRLTTNKIVIRVCVERNCSRFDVT